MRLIAYSDLGLESLKKWGSTTYIDGTHNVVKDGKTLTLILVRVGEKDEGVICVWYLHTQKNTSSYDFLFNTILKATEGEWAPKFFIMDFELAIRKSVNCNFIDTKVVLCFFHLKQSVTKWMKEYKIEYDDQRFINEKIDLIFHANSREDFNREVADCADACSSRSSLFWKYFTRNYIDIGCRFPPELWLVIFFIKPHLSNLSIIIIIIIGRDFVTHIITISQIMCLNRRIKS
jgi:hypothetical protein